MQINVILPRVLGGVCIAATALFTSCATNPSEDLPLSSAVAAIGNISAANTLLNQAKGYEKLGQISKAMSTYSNIAKRYPNATAAAEAKYAEGRLRDKQGDLIKAFDAYQELISRYPSSKHYAPAIARQETVAHAVANGIIKNNFLGMKTKIDPKKAATMLAHVRDNAPGAKSAPKAQYAIGRVWQKAGNAEKAIAAYQRINVDYPNSGPAPESLYQIGQILVLKSERGNQNKANLNQAKEIFQNLILRYPGHQRAADAKKRLAVLGGQDVQRSFDTAEFYRKKGQTKSAIFYYREVLRKTKNGQLHEMAKRRVSQLGG